MLITICYCTYYITFLKIFTNICRQYEFYVAHNLNVQNKYLFNVSDLRGIGNMKILKPILKIIIHKFLRVFDSDKQCRSCWYCPY